MYGADRIIPVDLNFQMQSVVDEQQYGRVLFPDEADELFRTLESGVTTIVQYSTK